MERMTAYLTPASSLGLLGLAAVGLGQAYGIRLDLAFGAPPLAAALCLALVSVALFLNGTPAIVLGGLIAAIAIGPDVAAAAGLARVVPALEAVQLGYAAAAGLALLGGALILRGVPPHPTVTTATKVGLGLCGAIGLAGLIAPVIRLHVLLSDYATYGIEPLTGAGLVLGAAALWRHEPTRAAPSEISADHQIPLFSGAILLVIAIGAGLAGFSVIVTTTERVLTDTLRVSLEHRLRTFDSAVGHAAEIAQLAASRPRFNTVMMRYAHGTITALELEELQRILDDIFKVSGVVGLTLETATGQRIAERGILANESHFYARLNAPHDLALLWDKQTLLRARLPMMPNGEHVSTLVMDVPLHAVDRMFADFAGLGSRGTMGICMPLTTQLRCLPSRSNGYRVVTSSRFINQRPVPMHHALNGASGVMTADDIHGALVVAAYAPIGAHPLGMVVKSHVDDLYQPIRERLGYLAAALGTLVLVGMLLLRWLITPMARKLVVEIRERNLAQQRLTHLAHYDSLTDLPNRVLFQDRLQQAMVDARRNHRLVALMLLDLDRFKNVNDTLGHGVGDTLLKQVAQRLLKCVRAGDTVSRLAGDEFALVLPGVVHPDNVSRLAQRVLHCLTEPFDINGGTLTVSASLGVTLYPNDDETREGLLKNADTAMYRAKEAGRNTCQFYTAEMHGHALKRMLLENRLRGALARNELLLHYQPEVNLKNGEIVGMEALLRWQDPELGMVSPLDFIPLAEETGLIGPIGEWVLRSACTQMREWQSAGMLPAGRVSVNLSARQFHKGLAARIANVLAETKLAPSALVLELTESSLMLESDIVRDTLNAIDDMGVQIAIDDFGTGYSSLGYLKRFPIDILKIDRSFVREIPQDTDDAIISTAIITMAHSLDIKVVAEGVETAEQLAFLRERGCDMIQGYFFSKPLPAATFLELVRCRQRLPRAATTADA